MIEFDIRTVNHRFSAVLAFAAGSMFCSNAWATKSYYIDEMTNYSNGNACDIANVNTITSSLQTQLNSDGWSGTRYTEFSAWPQDLWEECSSNYGTNGEDFYYGDNGFLTVFAGHGNAHLLGYSSTGNGGTYNGSTTCNTNLSNNSRLGEMDGAQAGFGMWLACSVVQSSELGTNMWQSLRQQAGWQNSINIGNDEPLQFYNATSSQTNANAWINQMGTNGRKAIIATFSSTSVSDCWNVHNAAKLKGNVYNSPRNNGASCGGGQPSYYYCYSAN
jgi:hypothetical protein